MNGLWLKTKLLTSAETAESELFKLFSENVVKCENLLLFFIFCSCKLFLDSWLRCQQDVRSLL